MMLVHGYSGVGKTTLVNEVHKPMVRDKVIRGEQGQSNFVANFLLFLFLLSLHS